MRDHHRFGYRTEDPPEETRDLVSAKLLAHTAVTVFRLAFDRWIANPEHQDLPVMFRDGLTELASALASRAPSA